MSIIRIASSMSKRMPWSVASLVLYTRGLPRGRGWEKTLDAYVKPNRKTAEAEGDLLDALWEHVLVGEKMVRFYHCTAKELTSIRERLHSLSGSVVAPMQNFPVLQHEPLIDEALREPMLSVVKDVPGGVAAVYLSVRTKPVREALPMDVLEGDVVASRDDVERVYAVVNVPYWAFDVIYVPDQGGQIEVRMDFPDEAPRENIRASFRGVEASFAGDLGFDCFSAPVNLFGLIDNMYQDHNEGVVVELHFNSAGATHSGRTRRTEANLRTDPYHAAGVRGLREPIEPFNLTIRWPRPVDAKRSSLPELTLHASATERSKAAPALAEVTVRRCASQDDFEHVITRINSHLIIRARV